ncbi:MAG: hypothetical protein V4805_15175 [Pseudomonadota bacterium]
MLRGLDAGMDTVLKVAQARVLGINKENVENLINELISANERNDRIDFHGIAVDLTVTVGFIGGVEHINTVASYFAVSTPRKSLLIPLLVGATCREDSTVERISKLFPAHLGQSIIGASQDDHKLDRRGC